MISRLLAYVVSIVLLAGCDGNRPSEFGSDGKSPPPFGSTVYINPDIITPADSSALIALTEDGRDLRIVFDHRTDTQISINAFVYTVQFTDGLSSEVLVNPDVDNGEPATLRSLVEPLARAIGRLPATLRYDIRSVVVNPGDEGFKGLFGQIYIYAESATRIDSEGFLEELLAHEGAHASLDVPHLRSAGWRDAQFADPTYISTYARDYPNREDVAESVVPWLAVRLRPERISDETREKILAAIPNRLEYLDSISWDLYPFVTGQ